LLISLELNGGKLLKIEDWVDSEIIFDHHTKQLKFIKNGVAVVKNSYVDKTDTIISLMDFISPHENNENTSTFGVIADNDDSNIDNNDDNDDISSRIHYYLKKYFKLNLKYY